MRIQANIYFTQSQVKCVPTDPELSSYCEQLALDDGALEFRLRLFAARVRGDAAAVKVALAVPPDCVLLAQDGPSPFGDIPEDELHVIPQGDDATKPAVAVERSVCDEVAAFAHSYGLIPAAIIIPGDSAGRDITLPLAACHDDATQTLPEVTAPCATTSAIEMPPALQRELHKRKQRDARKAERATKSWALGGVFTAAQAKDHAAIPVLPPVPPIPAFLRKPQDDAGQDQLAPAEQAPSAPPEVTQLSPVSPPATSQPEPVAANDAGAPYWRKRPAVMIATAACVTILLGTAAVVPTNRPMAEQAPDVAPPVMPAETAIAAAQAVAPPRASGAAQEITATPDDGAIVLSGSSSLPRSEALSPARALPPNIDDRAPTPIAMPRLDGTTGVGNGGDALTTMVNDTAPSRIAATFPAEPEITQIMPPRVPGRLSNNGRSIANLHAGNTPSPAQALRPVTLLRPTSALARIAPQPRPARPAPVTISAPAPVAPEPTTPSTLARVSVLGPASAPRPQLRPVSLMAGTRSATAAPVAPTTVANAPALAPDTLPQGPVAGLRVLAIVGTGDQRQALVQTGPNQTAVLVAGATTQRWQVLEVRREGIVLSVNGRQQLLPIGL
ncbi:hypothetical protein [Roseicyclus sp.]|uniref:hypothetical protein n=1 Tax=Roseicyclus sp. TaxID=1914329 RepID=UPI003F6BD4C8